jgi:hypothetical protein
MPGLELPDCWPARDKTKRWSEEWPALTVLPWPT